MKFIFVYKLKHYRKYSCPSPIFTFKKFDEKFLKKQSNIIKNDLNECFSNDDEYNKSDIKNIYLQFIDKLDKNNLSNINEIGEYYHYSTSIKIIDINELEENDICFTNN